MRAFRRSIRCGLAIVVCLLLVGMIGCTDGSSPEDGPPPATSPATDDVSDSDSSVDVLHYNLAGAKENKGQNDVIAKLLDQIEAEHPQVISLNEICGQQNSVLRDALAKLGYEGNYARNGFSGDCGINPSQGVAVYLKGGEPHSGEDYELGQSTACIRGGRHQLFACSTHLTAGREARGEAAELRRTLPSEADGDPMILAGDFNLEPSDSEMDALYATEPAKDGELAERRGDDRFYEVDMRGDWCGSPAEAGHRGDCTEPHDDPDGKIDYIFADEQHFTSEVTGEARETGTCEVIERPHTTSEVIRQDCSDHRQLWGTVHPRSPDEDSAERVEQPTDLPESESWTLVWHVQNKRMSCDLGPKSCLGAYWRNGRGRIDHDGTITGTVKLWTFPERRCLEPRNPNLSVHAAIRFKLRQTLKLTGTVAAQTSGEQAPDLDVTVEFGKVNGSANGSECKDGGRTERAYQRVIDSFDARKPVSVTVPGGDDGQSGTHNYKEIPIRIAGLRYFLDIYAVKQNN